MKTKVKINREELFKLYMKEVHKLCKKCDWVSTITPELCVGMVSDVIEANPQLLKKLK